MARAELATEAWINEYITPWDYYAHGIQRVLHFERTAFQDMYIVETGAYGKALVLDGKWQSCTGDEFLYHEPLVQPAMLLHGAPKNVLILGGGEGATAREVLRWRGVERCTMIDIDGPVVDACREHLPEMHQGAFEDRRTELVITDALQYLDDTEAVWDVVISDLSDPIEEGPSFKLFTKEYFEKTRRALKPDGVFVVQAGPVSPVEMHLHVRLRNTLKQVFDQTASYSSYVPTYAAPWSFILGGTVDPRLLHDVERVDHMLAEHLTSGLRMLDGHALLGMLHLPKHLREAIARETEIYTLERPPRFFGKSDV